MKNFIQIMFLLTLLLFPLSSKSQELINELVGGPITTLASYENKIYACTYGPIFTSTDDGLTWQRIQSIPYYFFCILFNGNEIYAGSMNGEIIYSSDKGANWEQINSTVISDLKARIVGFVKLGNKLFAGTSKGVFLTEDNGKNWVTLNNGLKNINLYDFVISGNNLVAGSFGGGIFLSSDNGVTWQESNKGLSSLYISKIRKSDNQLFISASGTFYSTDDGASWQKYTVNITTSSVGMYTINNDDYIFSSGDSLLLSTDKGQTWKIGRYTGLKTKVRSQLIKAGKYYYFGTEFGVYRSTDDGLTWQESNKGLTNMYGSFFNDGKNIFAKNPGSRVYLSKDKGSTWKLIFSDTVQSTNNLFFIDNNIILASTWNNGTLIYKSSDLGTTWNVINKQFTSVKPATLMKIGNTYLMGTGGNGLYVSEDDCATFNPRKGNLLDSAYIYTIIKHGSYLLAGTNGKGIFRSSDDGVTWDSVNNGYSNKSASGLISDGQNIYANVYFENKILYVSKDNGSSWTESTKGLPNFMIRRVELKGDTVFAGIMGGGIYFSTDKGSSWNKLNTGDMPLQVAALMTFEDLLFIGTWGYGGYVRSNTTDIEELSINDIKFFPNPASSYIKLPDEFIGADIEITNSLGILQFKGKYNNQIDISFLNPGVFFIKLGKERFKFVKI